MPNGYARHGFRILSAAAGAFIAAGLVYRLEPATLLGFALTSAGFFLASTARDPEAYHWGRVGLGGVLAYVGMMPFFFEAFFPLEAADWYFGAVLMFLAGILGLTAGAFFAMKFGNDITSRILARAGTVAITIAGLLWVPLDIVEGNYWWTPGNLATFVGGLFLLVGLIRMDATPTSSASPSKA